MSTGPGRVERTILTLIERIKHPTTADLCDAAFGPPPWTKAQRVSVLRAMHRIVAREPGWTAKQGRVGKAERPMLRFSWWPPPAPPKPKVKPQKVHEEIWCCEANFLTGENIWTRAVITSRGGAKPNRITVEWGGRRWQAHETNRGISVDYPFSAEERRRPEFSPTRPSRAQERARRAEERAWARANGFGGLISAESGGVSEEALAMLGLHPPPFTLADVQRAFRLKSQKHHPDHGGDPDFMRALMYARDAALAAADG